MKNLAALALVAVLAVPLTGAARGRVHGHFLLDTAVGVSIPVAERDWLNFADPTFKFSLRMGGEIWFNSRIGLAPEFTLSLMPVITDVRTGGNVLRVEASYGRVRALMGARLLFGFRVGAFFLRFGAGVDHIFGGERIGGLRFTAASTGATVEPGLGVQFKISRYGVLGTTLGFPIAFHDLFNNNPMRTFDVDILVFIGARI